VAEAAPSPDHQREQQAGAPSRLLVVASAIQTEINANFIRHKTSSRESRTAFRSHALQRQCANNTTAKDFPRTSSRCSADSAPT
jgi:hypothetical protein